MPRSSQFFGEACIGASKKPAMAIATRREPIEASRSKRAEQSKPIKASRAKRAKQSKPSEASQAKRAKQCEPSKASRAKQAERSKLSKASQAKRAEQSEHPCPPPPLPPVSRARSESLRVSGLTLMQAEQSEPSNASQE